VGNDSAVASNATKPKRGWPPLRWFVSGFLIAFAATCVIMRVDHVIGNRRLVGQSIRVPLPVGVAYTMLFGLQAEFEPPMEQVIPIHIGISVAGGLLVMWIGRLVNGLRSRVQQQTTGLQDRS
jgi:hypothetical protein